MATTTNANRSTQQEAPGRSVAHPFDAEDSTDDSVSRTDEEKDEPGDASKKLHRRRTLYLIRHGEAEHNVLEAEAQRRAEMEGESLRLPRKDILERMERARQDVLTDWALRDASLTEAGKQQARNTRRKLEQMIQDNDVHHPTEAMCSPLTRCLQTCKILLEGSDVSAYIRPEISERRTLLPPDTAKPLEEMLRYTRYSEFSDFNTDHMKRQSESNATPESTTAVESKEMLRERAGEMFHLLMECNHRHVLVVSHKGFLRELERGLLEIPDSPLFGNCEMRVYRVVFTMGDRRLVQSERIA